MSTARLRNLVLLLVITLLLASVLACEFGGGPAKPTITIAAPTSDTQFEEGDDVTILSSANDAKGVTRVELYVDGDLYRTDSSPSAEGEKSLAMAQTWVAADPGTHSLSVIAYNVDGAESDPWAVTVEVVEAGGVVTPPTPTTSTAPPPAATDTPLPPPEATATTPPPVDTAEPPPTDTPEPELPDLVLSGLLVTPPNPAWGDSVQVRFDVGNLGHAPSGPHKIVWRYGPAPADIIDDYKPALSPGSGGTVNWTLDHIYESFSTVATVDADGEVDEENEDNNSEQFMINVGPSPPDLYISEIRVLPSSPQQGSPAMVGLHIHNGGDTDAGPFRVIWRSAGPTVGYEWNVSGLDAGAASWQQCEYTYSGWNHNYTTTGIVDVDDDVDEADEDNNELVKMLDVRPD
ncbi:MAG TPA: CARDB domain-containing protein [Anaerolineae bacterium]|nr:CARDB domain-containing protein [Anaerolineae bacterium]